MHSSISDQCVSDKTKGVGLGDIAAYEEVKTNVLIVLVFSTELRTFLTPSRAGLTTFSLNRFGVAVWKTPSHDLKHSSNEFFYNKSALKIYNLSFAPGKLIKC